MISRLAGALYDVAREFGRICGPRVHRWWDHRPIDDQINQMAAIYHANLTYWMPSISARVTQRFPTCLKQQPHWHIQTINHRRSTLRQATFDCCYYQLPEIVRDFNSSPEAFCDLLDQRLEDLSAAFFNIFTGHVEALPAAGRDRFLRAYPRRLRAMIEGLEGQRKEQQRVFSRFVESTARAMQRDHWWPQSAW